MFVHDDGSGSRLYAAGGFRAVNEERAYFFAFLAAFFIANADAVINSADYFDYLRFYFDGCP